VSLWKRGEQYWMDVTVNGQRYREPLSTTDWREARELEKHRIAELSKRPPDPAKRGRPTAPWMWMLQSMPMRKNAVPKFRRAWSHTGEKTRDHWLRSSVTRSFEP